MDASFNFLLQASRVLYVGGYDEKELTMIYDFIVSIDKIVLDDYFNTCTILTYQNDLELYIEILDSLIKVLEEREEYEKCNFLMKKKNESIEIMNQKTI
jgi:hypothetical protein